MGRRFRIVFFYGFWRILVAKLGQEIRSDQVTDQIRYKSDQIRSDQVRSGQNWCDILSYLSLKIAVFFFVPKPIFKHRPQDQWKTNQKSITKSIKHLPKSIPNQWQINQQSTNNRSWRGLGGILVGLGGGLGGQDRKVRWGIPFLRSSWARLGAVLGASWGRLGAWIAVLGRLGTSWGRLGPSKTRCRNRSKNPIPFKIDFDAMLVEFKKKNGSKLALKMLIDLILK